MRLGASLILQPVKTLQELAQPHPRHSALYMVLFAALVHGLFSLVLYGDGHQPSFPSPLIPVQDHYLYQAVLTIPTYLLLWVCMFLTAHEALRRLGGKASRATSALLSGYCLAVPILILFLIPDLIGYWFGGFELLPKILRFSAPVTFFWVLWLWSAGMHWAHQVRLLYVVPVVLGAFLVSVSWVGIILR